MSIARLADTVLLYFFSPSFPLVSLENRVSLKSCEALVITPLSPFSPYPATFVHSASLASWMPSVTQAGSHPECRAHSLPQVSVQTAHQNIFPDLLQSEVLLPPQTGCHSPPALYFFMARITSDGVTCSFVLCVILHWSVSCKRTWISSTETESDVGSQ